VNKSYLVDLIWKDGSGEICRIGSSLIWRDLERFKGMKLEIAK